MATNIIRVSKDSAIYLNPERLVITHEDPANLGFIEGYRPDPTGAGENELVVIWTFDTNDEEKAKMEAAKAEIKMYHAWERKVTRLSREIADLYGISAKALRKELAC